MLQGPTIRHLLLQAITQRPLAVRTTPLQVVKAMAPLMMIQRMEITLRKW
jgi:hypothetical protein